MFVSLSTRNMKWNIASESLSKIYLRLGRLIARRPKLFTIIPILVTAISCSGFYNVKYEQDIDYLYNPDNSASNEARRLINTEFRMNYTSNFSFGRMTTIGRLGCVLITAEDGGSILRKDIFKYVVMIDRAIRNVSIPWKNKRLRFKSICAKVGNGCYYNDILAHADRISLVHERYRIIQYPITEKGFTFIPYNINLGNVTVDELNYVTGASAVRLVYFLDQISAEANEKATAWENAFLDAVAAMHYPNITLRRFAYSSIPNELTRTATSVIPLYAVLAIILLLFSCVTCSSTDCIISKPWLGVIGCVSTALAVLSSFGLAFHCYLPFTDLLVAIPFLLLGIGMDDTFVMLSAWRHTDTRKSVEERLGETYAESSVSITITSLTNLLCFCIGITTPFPVVRIFCAFASVSVVLTYVFQLTFFGGWLALYGYSEKENLHGLLFFKIQPGFKHDNSSLLQKLCCYGGSQETSSRRSSMLVYVWTTIGKYLERGSIKALTIVLFLTYLVIGVYFSTKVKEGAYLQMFFPFDSYAMEFFDADNKYFSQFKNRIQIVVNTPLNYADPVVQEQIENLLQEVESNRYISSSSFTESWLRQFLKFQRSTASIFYLNHYNLSREEDFSRALRDVFLRIPAVMNLKSDVIFNENGTKILASRFVVQSNRTDTIEDEKQALLDLRRIGKRYPYDVHFLHYMFVFLDQFLLVGEIALQAISIASAVMICIFLVFIPDISCAVWAGFTIVSIQISVIGYMTLWNVNLDTASVLNLIMCIGFSVDYVAHLSHAYIISGRQTKDHRLQMTLRNIGMPIFQGSASTVLCVSVLIFSNSYILVCFFKIINLVILLAAMHALFLLPVLLSLTDSLGNKIQNFRTVKKRQRSESRKQMLSSSMKGKKVQEKCQSDDDDDMGVVDLL